MSASALMQKTAARSSPRAGDETAAPTVAALRCGETPAEAPDFYFPKAKARTSRLKRARCERGSSIKEVGTSACTTAFPNRTKAAMAAPKVWGKDCSRRAPCSQAGGRLLK
ncbi:hypothetical protein TRVL_02959 [Trypanosoma vivax]|nr:hypothetical protein TRVL_02959 [Trypanosoma vivax]